MNIPIKIIHKFKNNNRRIQYIQYIFIGSNLSDEIMNILDSIKNKNFFETFENLNKNKLDKLSNYYGEKWYTYFFNRYHLAEQFNSILKNINKKKILETKMGKEWVAFHLSSPLVRQVTYSFATAYYDYLITRNKIKSAVRKADMDFRTYMPEMSGGNMELSGDADEDNYDNQNDNNIQADTDVDDEGEGELMANTIEDFDEMVNNNFNLEELALLYSKENEVNSKNVKSTALLISEATNDKSFLKNIDKINLEFNDKLDDITFDAKLEDVYQKVYITDQFIFMDDNIKTIRNKLTVSVPISDKFGENIKLLPEYMYFWTEYNYNNNTNTIIDRVMLGQKWIRRNELVIIDIKPNENISVYENLRNNLSYLKDSFGIKIKREDDEYNILRDYEQFMTNNEIYMIDILNELGLNYDTESSKKKNVYEVYVNIYYPLISFERLENIFDLLNNRNEKELEKNSNTFGLIKNDMVMEKQIYELVTTTETSDKISKWDTNFKPNYIIQSTIHVNLNNPKNLTGTVSSEKYNLYKIFDNFIVSEEYPFIQYQTPDSQLTYKFFTKTKKIDDMEILSKWFETAPYGISFKIKMKEIENKYISINLNENGRLEYKITWKEEDQATIDSIKQSYHYVNDLLLKINSENKKIKFILPEDNNYKYAFINTIQKFTLNDKYKINHNDLSDFCRFFYTYIAVVIEPKKRISKTSSSDKLEFSKFGTYLRYKRISNYENKTKMHLRMLYFLRNFEISDKELIDEVAKQFNITQEAAAEELDIVRSKYGKVLGKLKKSQMKLKALPKAKPPGIGIDIQGRTPDNYKIRITGARSREQLEEIVNFIKTLLYLYVETYIIKNSKYIKIKDMLNKLTKIAKRRNKVNDMVNYEAGVSAIKQATALDKKRLGFKPEEGQNQWSRSCQNSGDDKKRQPLIISSDNVKELVKRGYKLNPDTNNYEKKVVVTEKGKKKEVTIKAVKLPGENGTSIYYTCDPENNNEHCYIGFLSKSNNPNDLCMPCCFKKNHADSDNKKKKAYYMQCVGQKVNNKELGIKDEKDLLGDKVYILQDTNKVQDGRFIFLPKYMNQFFNIVWHNTYSIKNHYLVESDTGYNFKYTVKDPNHLFLAAMSHVYNKSIDELKDIAKNALMKDNTDKLFSYLNNGDVKSMFKEKENFIRYIDNSNYLEYDIMGELLGLPGVLSEKGIFYFIFDKKIKVIKKQLEKDKIVENYYLQCMNYENFYTMNEDREFVILIKDGKYYFPIYNVKKSKSDKKIILRKKYNNNDKLIDELKKYYSMSCIESFIYKINKSYNITAKLIYQNIGEIKKQIVDMRNKVRYLKLSNDLYLPVKPSGTLLDIPISNINSLKSSDFMDLDTTIKLLNKINNKYPDLNYLPKVVNYNNNKDNTFNIISILLFNGLIIPIKNEYVPASTFKKYGLGYEFQSMEEVIDQVIITNEIPFDNRSINVKNRLYRNEAYNLLRLELSIFLANNNNIKNIIIGIVRNNNISKDKKRKELMTILLKIIENKINPNKKSFEIKKELPKLNNYHISNVREYCAVNKTKDKCDMNLHCYYVNNNCTHIIYKSDMIHNLSKIIEEMIMDNIKFKEILQEETYYVSDIVDYTVFSDRPNQKIIKTSNFNIKKIMTELFGKDSIPQLGKRRIGKQEVVIENDIPELLELGKEIIQEIVSNKNSIIRAYVNCYYWLLNTLYDKETRNLGYESEIQDRLTNLFKANMIDYIVNNVYNEEFKKDVQNYISLDKDILSKNIFSSSISRIRKNNFNTDGILELIILSYMFPYPIVVYDNYNAVKYIFSSGPVSVNEKTIAKYINENNFSKTIFLKLDYEGSNKIPKKIYSVYHQ
jgi:hypothetical protein